MPLCADLARWELSNNNLVPLYKEQAGQHSYRAAPCWASGRVLGVDLGQDLGELQQVQHCLRLLDSAVTVISLLPSRLLAIGPTGIVRWDREREVQLIRPHSAYMGKTGTQPPCPVSWGSFTVGMIAMTLILWTIILITTAPQNGSKAFIIVKLNLYVGDNESQSWAKRCFWIQYFN